MAAKLKPRVETPETVVRYGWRDPDDAYKGPDVCGRCHGKGTLVELIGEGGERRPVHRTCEACRGRGHT
jgi:DnaJ-class molecular chaperone